MSPPEQRETPRPGNQGALQSSGDKPKARLKPNTLKPSQKERCRRALTRGWTCGVEFLNPSDGWPPILRYSSRISELRRDGYYVDRRVCDNRLHGHPHSTMYEWRITGHVSDGTLPLGAPE